MTFNRVKEAVKKAYIFCPLELELWYLDGLTELILIQRETK